MKSERLLVLRQREKEIRKWSRIENKHIPKAPKLASFEATRCNRSWRYI